MGFFWAQNWSQLSISVALSMTGESVPSWKPLFPGGWRLLVKELVAKIGISLHFFNFFLLLKFFFWFFAFFGGVTCDRWQVTCDTRYMTCDIWLMTFILLLCFCLFLFVSVLFCQFLSVLVSVILSAQVEGFNVSCMLNFDFGEVKIYLGILGI